MFGIESILRGQAEIKAELAELKAMRMAAADTASDVAAAEPAGEDDIKEDIK